MSASIPDLTQNRALHRDVEAYVVQMIRAGELRPGERVNEAEVARRLQISRTPVREAFARLIKDNILEHLPRRGVFVASLSRDNVEEITSLRAVLEGFAARRACQRITPSEIERLRQVVAEGAAAGDRGDWLSMEEKNAEFHDLLIAGAHHALLARVWRTLSPSTWKISSFLPPAVPTPEIVHDFVRRHQQVLDALTSGDPCRAEQAATAHVERAREHLLGPTD